MMSDDPIAKLQSDVATLLEGMKWLRSSNSDQMFEIKALRAAVAEFKEGCRNRHEALDGRIVSDMKCVENKLRGVDESQNERIRKIEDEQTASKAKQYLIVLIISLVIGVLSFFSTMTWFRGSVVSQIQTDVEQMKTGKAKTK